MGAAPSTDSSGATHRTDATDVSSSSSAMAAASPQPSECSAHATPESTSPEVQQSEVDVSDEEFDDYAPPPAWAMTPVLPKPPKRSGFFSAMRSPLKELERTR